MSYACLQVTVQGFANDGAIRVKTSWAAVRYLEGLRVGPKLGPKAFAAKLGSRFFSLGTLSLTLDAVDQLRSI